jgi:predicted SAM-dependent methyltransferase
MPRKLLIGGTSAAPGWEVLNAVAAPYVDHVCNANDLSRFEPATFSDIYASHVVEHLDYRDELQHSLAEWHRVLQPSGRVLISVPDLDVLARLFLDRSRLTIDERFMVMRMMFGGHVDEFDYHMVGLNDELLAVFLFRAGFTNLRRVQSFGLFADTSAMVYKGTPISLNMVAEKAAA